LIIDNNSNKNTKDILIKLENSKIKTIYNEKNYGIARALNEGVKFARENKFKWILTMDQDSIAESKMINKMLECTHCYSNNEKVVSFSPTILDKRVDIHYRKKIEPYQESFTAITSGNLLNVNIFNKLIRYEEKLFIDSVDFDFCLKLHMSNYIIIRCNNTFLFHELGEIKFKKIFGFKIHYSIHSLTRKYYMIRNNIYIFKKYFWKFPFFCIKKQIFTILECLKIFLVEKDKILNIKFMIKGFLHGIINRYNEIDEINMQK